MKLLLAFLTALAVFTVSDAAVAINLNATHPDYPGLCYDGDAFSPGEKIPMKKVCGQKACYPNFSIQYFTCGAISVESPGCVRVGQDLSKPYPDCCNPYVCNFKGFQD